MQQSQQQFRPDEIITIAPSCIPKGRESQSKDTVALNFWRDLARHY